MANVHDLHVWQLTAGKPLLMAHLDVDPGADITRVLLEAEEALHKLGITHTTLQVEPITLHSEQAVRDMLAEGAAAPNV